MKAVSELFIPVSSEVVEVNEELGAAPEAINGDPYGKGWMIRIRIRDAKEHFISHVRRTIRRVHKGRSLTAVHHAIHPELQS